MLLEMDLPSCEAAVHEVESACANPIVLNEANNNEISGKIKENGRTISVGTPIQEFYAGQTVFITGGTGFLGKILVEKLLRSCPDLAKIYLLIRPKKGKDVQIRIEELFKDPIFQRMKETQPKYRQKVVAVAGDCSVRDLGLSSTDRALLIREVSVVFHVAATVRFDEKLKLALAINVKSTGEIINMCKEMPNLKSVIHVSTAYANCHESTIGEHFYDYSIDIEELFEQVDGLSDNAVEEITPRIIAPWPNTYTFTKAIAEDLVKQKNKGLPMGIFRPAVVISTAHEPIPGWIDNLYGPTGVVTGASSGVLRSLHCDSNITANVVPVDMTVNALISSAWDVASQVNRRQDDMLIYNFVSSVEAPLKWGDYCETNLRYGRMYPLSNCIWYLSFRMYTSKLMYWISILLLHLLPALIVDTLSICIGRKPRLWKTYRKIHKFLKVIAHFCMIDWTFTNDNVQTMWGRLSEKDRQLFKFSMKEFNWSKYFTTYMTGIRLYLFKDDLSTLEASRARLRRFYWMHQTMKAVLLSVGAWALCSVSSKILF